jgi:hypothetical protein
MYHFLWRLSMMAGEHRIKNYHVEDALEQINQAEYGAHYLIVYPDLRILRELYTKYVKTQLEHENKIVLLLPHYETADNIRNIFLDDSFPAAEDSLIVMDSLKAHFGVGNHMEFVNDLVKRAQNGVSVIADAGSFFHIHERGKLIEHELSMPPRFDVNLKRFCVFHKQDFNLLTEEQKQKLLNHHGQVLMVEDR